jgi:hypothetical protein
MNIPSVGHYYCYNAAKEVSLSAAGMFLPQKLINLHCQRYLPQTKNNVTQNPKLHVSDVQFEK